MNNRQIKIIFFGTPLFVTPVLNELINQSWLVGVVTAPDAKTGRNQKVLPSGIALHSPYHKNLTIKPEQFDENFINTLDKLHPDLIIVAAYGKIIPQAILNIAKYGALNIHPSLLPKYRGASPIQTAIMNGDTTSGISIIKMDAKMDHGPLVYQEKFSLSQQDTFQTLSNLMFQRASKILIELIPNYINGKIRLKAQNHQQASFCKMIKKTDGYFDISHPPSLEMLDRMIRAYHPWPNVWTRWNGKIVKFYPNDIVQIEGKKPTKLEDFLRGYPDFPITRLI